MKPDQGSRGVGPCALSHYYIISISKCRFGRLVAGKKQGKWSIINRLQWVHGDMSFNIYSGMISTQYGPDPHKTQVRGFSLKNVKNAI